jgi:hypothetical protein
MALCKQFASLTVMVLAISIFAQAQDARWNIDPSATGLGPVTDPAQMPKANPNYVNPNKSLRLFQTPHELLAVAPNFRVHPSTITWQSEVPITRHPSNPDIMFASSNAVRFSPTFISEGVYVTTDGGSTWFGSDTNSATPVTGHSGDPAPVIDKDGRFIETYLGGGTGMQGSYSTNYGLTWAPSVAIPGGSSSDKNLAGADDVPSSPFYGRTYNVWTNFAGTYTNRIVISYTTNGGVSWSTAAPVSPPPSTGHHHQGCDVRVGPAGQVYVIWANCTTNGQNSTEDSLGFAMSTDGGVTWPVSTNHAADMNGIRAASYFNSIRVSGFPRIDVDRSGGPRNGWIYVVAGEKTIAPATDAGDAILTRSTDGGVTWTRSRINQDTPGSGKRQYMAAVSVDLGGGVNVVYYDQRNTTLDSAEVYMSRSIDGGDTWEDILVSDAKFRPTPISGLAAGYQGDYIGITSTVSKAFPYWCDNRTGIYQAWTAAVTIADPVDPNPPSNVSAFSDYSTPTSMLLRWTRPTTLVNGTPIPAFVTRIKRNGVQISERPQTDSTFTDTGLIDGTPYAYLFSTRLTGNDSLSAELQASWIAGGSRIPKGPTNLAVTGTQASGFKVKWRNPSQQIDETRLDDLAGIRLYRDGVLATTLVRTSADTARADSTLDNPAPGLHRYYVTAIDNELPVNESVQSNSGDTPIELPVQEFFTTAGAPNPILWRNVNAVIDSDAVNEPSAPFSLNLAGNATGLGLDTLTSNSIDLSGRQGSAIKLGYWQQPQGNGDVPEAADSLITEALNDQGTWIALQKLPGAANRPFQFVSFNMDSVSAGTGTFFFNGFRFRFRSKATTATTTRQDDWFVDDVFFGVPTGTPVMAVAPQSIVDTVLVGKRDSTRYGFTVSNTNSFGTSLDYTVAESPAVSWLTASPTGGSIPGGSSNIIRVAIDFTGIVQGNYTTRLIVTGNAPANTADTVNISFRVNNAPVIGTTPASFTFNLNQGDSVSSALKIKNTGLGPLTYTTGINGGFAGDTATDIGSSQLNLTTTSLLLRGGVVGVTRNVQLTEIKPYLTITTAVQLAFVVYENTAQTGTFTKIFERIATSGTGTQFYSSGPMTLTLQAGKFYAIGVAWSAGLNYFWSTNIPVPVATSFGSITGGLASTLSSFPPPTTVTQSATSSLYYTQIITANGKWLNITTNGSGTVNPGDSTLVGFKVTTAVVPAGTQNSAIVVNSNDPVTPTDTTNVALTVITSITERGSGLPATYELSQNYPNPFNPTTRIEFALPEESTIRLKVYNILGQEIATLANEQRPAGYFVAEWNATNNFGNKVSSGVYFYKMEANSVSGENSFQSLKKMLILK